MPPDQNQDHAPDPPHPSAQSTSQAPQQIDQEQPTPTTGNVKVMQSLGDEQVVGHNAQPFTASDPEQETKHSKTKRVVSVLALLILLVLAYIFIGVGPSSWSISSASNNASTLLADQAGGISIPNPVINKGVDQGCAVQLPTEFGHFTSTISCTYYYHKFWVGSGNQTSDFNNLISQIQAQGFTSKSYSIPSDVYFHLSQQPQEQLNTELITSQNNLSTAGGNDTEFLKLAQGKVPTNKYLYGFTIHDTYTTGTCIFCLGFEERMSLTGHAAPPIPASSSSIDTPAMPVSFQVFLPGYLPNTKFITYTKKGSWFGIYYYAGDTGDQTGFLEFPTPSYYNPPNVCGDGTPDGEQDSCEELLITPMGRVVYYDNNFKGYYVLYTKINNTVVVFYTSLSLSSGGTSANDSINGSSNVLTPSQIAALTPNSFEVQLTKVIDSLEPPTPAQLSKINSSPNHAYYSAGNPQGF